MKNNVCLFIYGVTLIRNMAYETFLKTIALAVVITALYYLLNSPIPVIRKLCNQFLRIDWIYRIHMLCLFGNQSALAIKGVCYYFVTNKLSSVLIIEMFHYGICRVTVFKDIRLLFTLKSCCRCFWTFILSNTRYP